MLLKIVVNAVSGAQGSISCIEPLGFDLQGKGQGSTKTTMDALNMYWMGLEFYDRSRITRIYKQESTHTLDSVYNHPVPLTPIT